MKQASELFNSEQRDRVEQAVAQAETQTTCEIVPVVATVSGRYDRPEDIVGLWLAALAAVGVWIALPREPSAESGSWGSMSLPVGVLIMIAAIAAGFIAGALIGSRVGWLRRLFTPGVQMEAETAAKAREVFFDKRVHHTTGATGLLIYVSLFEHIAVVLADQEVLDKMGRPFLDSLCRQLTESLHNGQLTEALCEVIEAAGTQLAPVLPRVDQGTNQLHNALVLID